MDIVPPLLRSHCSFGQEPPQLSSSALHSVDSHVGAKSLRLANSWLLTVWLDYKSLLPSFKLSELIMKTQTHRSIKKVHTIRFFYFICSTLRFLLPCEQQKKQNCQGFPLFPCQPFRSTMYGTLTWEELRQMLCLSRISWSWTWEHLS